MNTARSRRLSSIVVALALFAAFSSAHAQNWFGVRSGYPLGVTLHYGVANALANGFDLRVSGRVTSQSGNTRVGVGVDAMGTVAAEGPFGVYIGAGPAIDFGSGGAWLDIHALAGAEFRFVDFGIAPLGLFVEATLGGSFGLGTGAAAQIPTFGAALGVNYHF
ncbi:MAG: hypothetical protein R6W77_01330 [Trueperaceae bacterium]